LVAGRLLLLLHATYCPIYIKKGIDTSLGFLINVMHVGLRSMELGFFKGPGMLGYTSLHI